MIRSILILALLAASAWGADASLEAIAQRELIVKWRNAPGSLDAVALALPVGVAVRQALPVTERTSVGLERISVITAESDAKAAELMETLRRDPRVEYAEPRLVRHTDGQGEPGAGRGRNLDGVPDDPFYSLQWGLPVIEAETAWNITRGDPSIIIAVLDLGVHFGHPELAHTQWFNVSEQTGQPGVDDDENGFVDDVTGWDFVDNDNDPTPSPLEPPESHGTHVAGIAAAARNNGQGIAGLAPECRIMNVRVGKSLSVPFGYEGIYYACRAGAKIINCSWGGSGDAAYERDVIRYATEQGCIVVAAAGNAGTNEAHFPAALEGVVGVAASDVGDYAASFTQFGRWIDVSAPGVSMLSTIIGAGGAVSYDTYHGTSMATPLVAAACALVASRYPQMGGREIAARVATSADPIDGVNPSQEGLLGLGRLNVWRALADSVAGVRIAGATYQELSGNGDGRIRAGESATIRIGIFNNTYPLGSVVGRVVSEDERVRITSPVLIYGEVPVGGPYWPTTSMTVELPADAERGYVLPLMVDWQDESGRLIGRGRVEVLLDSTYVAVGTGTLLLGFAENGSLGYSDYERNYYVGPGLRVSGHSNALYHGSFLLAADGVVQENGYGNAERSRMDWTAVPDSFAHLVPSARAPVEARATFDDRMAETPLFARVDAAALAWQDPERDQFLILEYTVTNRSVNAWAEAYAGFFLDFDLGSAAGNVAAYDAASGVAYVRQVLPTHPLVGIVSVGEPWFALDVVDNRLEIDAPADWSDAEKWERLQQGITPGFDNPRDISFLIATGPFALEAHAQQTFAFAFVVGESVEELRTQAARAQNAYAQPGQGPAVTAPKSVSVAGLFPNPLPQGAALRLVLSEAESATVQIYNLLGQLVAEISDVTAGPQGAMIDRRRLDGASGLLFYRIESASGTRSGKLMILR